MGIEGNTVCLIYHHIASRANLKELADPYDQQVLSPCGKKTPITAKGPVVSSYTLIFVAKIHFYNVMTLKTHALEADMLTDDAVKTSRKVLDIQVVLNSLLFEKS